MHKLHNKNKQGTLIEYGRRAQESLCSNALSKETLVAIGELGEILKNIHARLVSEGYEITDGCIRKKLQK